MLRGIRDASSGKFGKIVMSLLFGILIISFGLWGIADIFTGYGKTNLASVGKAEISIEQFRTLYNDKLQQISRQLGRPMTPAQARKFGIDRQVLQQVLAETALDEEARRMALTLSDAEIARQISTDPNFADASGKFDPQRFAYTLRQASYTEQRYVAEQRRTSLRSELAGSFTAGIAPSKTQIDALIRFQNEERVIDYVKLDAQQGGTIETPAPATLQAYYDEHKAMFRAPEYRKVALLALTPEELAKTIVVSDEDAKKVFEQNSGKYVKPERRQILQIAFPTPEAAKAADDKIAAGLSFEDLAKEMKLSESDIDLGTVSEASVGDPAIAKAAFALPVNKVSEPIKGALATALIKVVKIEPGSAADFASVAPAIKQQIAVDRARNTFQEQRNKIEDERGGGANILEAAKKLNLNALTVDIDRSGRGPDGKPVTGLPQGVDLVSLAFAGDVGVETDSVPLGTGELWYDVLGITPSRDRTLDEVKDEVAKRWHDEQIASRLRTKVNALIEQINKGADFASVAKAAGLSVSKTAPFKRLATINGLPDAVVEAAFRTAKGEAGQTEGTNGSPWVAFRVVDVIVPTVDENSEDAKKLKDLLVRSMTDEQTAEYVMHLENTLGVSVNQSAFANATGASSSQ